MHNPRYKAPLSFYGGKQSLLHHIIPLIPEHDCYTEVCVGGASVFWAKEKVKNETINDTSGFVVNFYEQLKGNFAALQKLIDASLIARDHHLKALVMYRNQADYSPLQKAWAFWYLANFSFANKFGGGLKYSNHACTVVPDQLKNKKKRFTERLVARIEDCCIENRDYVWVLESRNVKTAWHFIDTPYFNADMGHYGGFTEADLIRGLDWCEGCRGKFMLTNYNSEVLDFYINKNGWYKKEVTQRLQAPRKSTIGKLNKTEVMVLNYNPTALIENSLFRDHDHKLRNKETE